MNGRIISAPVIIRVLTPTALCIIVWLGLSLALHPACWAENVAPGAHWGAIDFPDRDPSLLAGFTVNRFTEFNGRRERFNAIGETAGFNFATVSWTDRLKAFPEWSGNLTFGGGLTGENPSSHLQNSFLHRTTGQSAIPVGQTRSGADAMAGGSLTRWSPLFASRDTGFAGIGVAGGSLYQEVYGRVGIRELSLGELASWLFPHSNPWLLNEISRFVRFSAMGRYSRLYGGVGYSSDVIADQSYLGQASVSFADFCGDDAAPPRWAVEVAVTYDSGLFAAPTGRWLTRRFGSIALHFPYGSLESWNDWVGSTDSGPTYGFTLLFDVRKLSSLLTGL